MDKNVRLGALVVIFGSLLGWLIVICAIVGAINIAQWLF